MIILSDFSKYKKIKFDIPISNIIMTILGIFIGSITYYFEVFKRFNLIINLIVITILILIIFFFISIYSLIKYLKLIKIHNNLLNEVKFADDNRNTLDKLIYEKNKEIEELKSSNYQMKAQRSLLYLMLLHDEKPNPLIIKDALKIEERGLYENEE